jgi:folate-binding protein YgfZ
MIQHSTPVRTSGRSDEYEHVRRHAGVIRRDRGRILVSGPDRASYLQGLLTNDIVALRAGTGCYAAYLTPQGRMITDLWVYELGDVVLLTMDRDVKDALLAKLDQFVFNEDVRLGDATETWSSAAVVGPEAASVISQTVSGVDAGLLDSLPEHSLVSAAFAGQPVTVLRVTDTGEPGFDLLLESAHLASLVEALAARNVRPLDPAIAEVLRVEAGVPKFHQDMDEDTIPLEAGIEGRAISLTKGCYVGQEVIVRVLHRGHGRVARRLVGLTIDGDVPPPVGSRLQVDGRDVGRVTSSVLSPALGRPIALASIQRVFTLAGTRVVVAGVAAASVTALPFVGRGESASPSDR